MDTSKYFSDMKNGEILTFLLMLSIFFIISGILWSSGYMHGLDTIQKEKQEMDLFDENNGMGYLNMSCVIDSCMIIEDEEAFRKHIERNIIKKMEERKDDMV